VSDPVIIAESGRLRLELPDPPDDHRFYPVTGAVLQGFVDQVNWLRDQRDQLRAALQGIADVTNDEHAELTTIARHALSAAPESCPQSPSGKPCGTTEMAASIGGPSGARCACGWEFGTYAEPPLHPTRRDLDRMEGP